MAKTKREIKEFEAVPNPWKGDQPKTIQFDPKQRSKGKSTIIKNSSKETKEIKQPPKEAEKKPTKATSLGEQKIEKPKRSKLTETEQRVLDFIKTLDHPANSVEVRDKFKFPLRADARRIFRKLDKLGFGENRKIGRKYAFYVKGKVYRE